MASPLTIAHVDSEKGWSGGQVQVFLLMEGLRSRGHRNVLFCPPGSRQEARARELGLDVVPVAMRNDMHLAAVGRLRRGFRDSAADLVHLHTGRANWLGGLAARRAGLPALTTRRMDHPVKRHLLNRLVYGSFVERAVGIAPAVSEHLLEGGVDASLVRTIWSTVDPAALLATKPREQVRAEWGATSNTTVMLAAAKLNHRKGLDLALAAFARCVGDWDADGESALTPDSARDAVLWIAGDGPERVALEALTTELDLGARVTFLGRREDMPDLLAAADLLLMPSRSEGLGIAALEAMAAGLPVIGCRVGGLGEAVIDGRTGLLVPPDDIDALSVAIQRLLGDSEERLRLGRNGPKRIDEGFRAEQMVEAYEALYRELLAEKAAATANR